METFEEVKQERDRLKVRVDELLQTLVRVSNETPFPEEATDALKQRGVLIAEIGTLRAERNQLAEHLSAALTGDLCPVSEREQRYCEGWRDGMKAASEECERQAVRLERKLEDTAGEIWKDGKAMASGARHAALYIRMACHAAYPVAAFGAESLLPDLDLLRKLAAGKGGRRTGDLMRRGFIRVEVTEAGRRVLEENG